MADAKELIQRITQFRQALTARRTEDTLRIATDLKGLMQLRIQTKGETAAGAAFAAYSDGHKRKREKEGRQIIRYDFTFTGDFWRSVKALVVADGQTITKVDIMPEREDNIDKLKGHTYYRPNEPLLQPSASELNLARRANALRVQRLAESYGIPLTLIGT
jgi:hypothetical protein